MRFKIVKTLAPYGFHVVDTADGRMVASFKRKKHARVRADGLGRDTVVERVDLMTGQKYMESVDRPDSCSPSSETHWSM